jgi:hypothetical protein
MQLQPLLALLAGAASTRRGPCHARKAQQRRARTVAVHDLAAIVGIRVSHWHHQAGVTLVGVAHAQAG